MSHKGTQTRRLTIILKLSNLKKHHVWLIDASKSSEMHFIKYTPKYTWTVYNLNIIFLVKLYLQTEI